MADAPPDADARAERASLPTRHAANGVRALTLIAANERNAMSSTPQASGEAKVCARCEKRPRHTSHKGASKYCDGCIDTILGLSRADLVALKASCTEPSTYTGEDSNSTAHRAPRTPHNGGKP